MAGGCVGSRLNAAVTHRQINRREVLGPFLAALRGSPVPYSDLVQAGRMVAAVLVAHGRPISVCGDGPWAGVWDLERLTDDEAVIWGMWVATKVRATRPEEGRQDGA
jgi:hypothetical protein